MKNTSNVFKKLMIGMQELFDGPVSERQLNWLQPKLPISNVIIFDADAKY
jgi:hypothetical protein